MLQELSVVFTEKGKGNKKNKDPSVKMGGDGKREAQKRGKGKN